MLRAALSALAFTITASLASGSFILSGNPQSDGWTLKSHSLVNGGYVRGGANFSYHIYTVQFSVPNNANPLTTMTNPWTPGDRIIGMGGVFTAPLTPAQLQYPPGTVFTGPAQNSLIGPNTRFIAKFGVDFVGPGGNAFSPASAPPVASVAQQGNGSFSGGNGGMGSVQVSIASNRFTPATDNLLLTPNIVGLQDNVAQYDGLFFPTPGHGSQGLDLITGTEFLPARYIFTTDANGFLSTWEVLLNTRLVGDYPGALPTYPTGGNDWLLAVQQGSGASTDGLTTTLPFAEAPAPPALYLAVVGGAGLLALRRRRLQAKS